MKHSLLFFLACLCYAITAKAQFTLYNTTNTSVPTNEMRDIAFAAGGIKWFANAGGLIRFDGTTWTVYDTVNADLPGLPVYAVEVNPVDNSVWVVSDNNASNLGTTMSRFDGTAFTQHVATACYSFLDASVSGLDTDPSGGVWTVKEGLTPCANIVRFDGTAFTGLPFPNGDTTYWNNHMINSVDAVTQTDVWVGTMQGLLHYNAGVWDYYDNVNSELPSNGVMCVRKHGNKIWMACGYDNIVSFDGTNWEIISALTHPVLENMILGGCVDFDSQGRMWTHASTFTVQGIASYDGISWTFYNTDNTNIPGDGAVYIDANDDVWVRDTEWGLAVMQSSSSVGNVNVESYLHPYPNPASTEVFMQDLPSTAMVEVYNALGQRADGWQRINRRLLIAELPSGLYTVRAINGNAVFLTTFVKIPND